ncbi:DUF971 domain-containing protein [bacterium]|jgi:DUF971 family protein|nr:DUF971 domain-containing protein [bacterium]
MKEAPTRIQLDKPSKMLIIDWPNGQRHRFPWTYLRANCPSATEKASREAAVQNPLQVLSKLPSSELISIRPVGRYAISLGWSDGHSVGIYTWEYLGQLACDPSVIEESL